MLQVLLAVAAPAKPAGIPQLCVVTHQGKRMQMDCAAKAGTAVTVVLLDGKKTLKTRAAESCPAPEGSGQTACTWLTPLDAKANTQVMLAVAVVGAPAKVTSVHGLAFQIDSSAARFTLKTCASAEGIHFTAWSGEPLASKRLWHDYQHLDYDTDADCREAEYDP